MGVVSDNERWILGILREHPLDALSAKELGVMTGLRSQTVGKLANQLVREGLVRQSTADNTRFYEAIF